MAQATTTNPADYAYRRVVYLSTKLLQVLENNLRMAQFAEKKSAPAEGLQAIRFFRPRKAKGRTIAFAAGQGPTNLTEGTPAFRRTEVSVGHVDCYLNQRGDDFEISDIARATDVLDTLNVYMETAGRDAALDFDSILSAAIFGNASTLWHLLWVLAPKPKPPCTETIPATAGAWPLRHISSGLLPW
jgi:hypothetical protein